jgi:hypothetical protein
MNFDKNFVSKLSSKNEGIYAKVGTVIALLTLLFGVFVWLYPSEKLEPKMPSNNLSINGNNSIGVVGNIENSEVRANSQQEKQNKVK